MEIDIDPLSMLEQTMQIDECSVNAEASDEDVVCLTDKPEAEVVVLDEDSNHSSLPPREPANPPIVIGTVPNGTVLFDPGSQTMSMVMETGSQEMSMVIDPNLPPAPLAPIQDESGGFGEHFLISSSSTSNSILTYPENADSPPGMNCVEPPRVNGKSRTLKSPRTVSKSKTKKGNSSLNIAVGSKKNQITMSTNILNQKLVNNVKRLSLVSVDEQNYRFKMYDNVEKVIKSNLDCTVCGAHIGCRANLKVFLVTHPLLKVLTCTTCRQNYCNKDWTVGSQNKDIRCRWCSLPASARCMLFNCSNCPFAFCEKCISRNYCRREVRTINGNPKWLCYVCQMVPLYYLRATCWALGLYICNINRRPDKKDFLKDTSSCCKSKGPCINLDEDEVLEVQVPIEKPAPIKTVSCQAISSRLDVMFSSIDTIKSAIRLTLHPNIKSENFEEFVSTLNVSLAKIGRNVESCLEYIENWRVFSLKQLKQQDKAKKRTSDLQRRSSDMNGGSQDYSYLLKKFNIKPCRVVLERLEDHRVRQETSEPPNFFLSLLPQPPEEISVIDDDDEIICLDD